MKPHIPPMAKSSTGRRSIQKGSGQADARQGARPDLAADRAGARELLNPGIEKGTAGIGLADRARAAAGQFLRPPRRFLRRAPRAQIDARASRRRRSRATCAKESPSSIPSSPRARFRRERSQPPGHRRDPHDRDEISDISDPQREKRQRPRQAAADARRHRHRAGAGAAAARGPPGIQRQSGPTSLDAAPAAAAGEIRRRPALRHQVRVRAEGRPAAGDPRTGRGRATATTARRCCSASPARARPSPWPR